MEWRIQLIRGDVLIQVESMVLKRISAAFELIVRCRKTDLA